MAEGTIELMGRTLTWSSPRMKDLIEFETIIGPLIGANHIDSMAGRAYAALICLREHHSDITIGQLHNMRADDAAKLSGMIMAAIPFWGSPQTEDSKESSTPAPTDSTGRHLVLDENASPTSS